VKVVGKVKLFIASSLDGFITRKDGSVDWLFTDQDYGYLEFYEPIEFILMGRKTYEKVLECGEYPYPGKKCFVFTHSPLLQQHSKDIEFFSGDIGLFVRKLCEHSTADIWLVGGSEIIKVFLQEKILHEIIVSIHPVILVMEYPFSIMWERRLI
jgi:dihydrofolate reductase